MEVEVVEAEVGSKRERETQREKNFRSISFRSSKRIKTQKECLLSPHTTKRARARLCKKKRKERPREWERETWSL